MKKNKSLLIAFLLSVSVALLSVSWSRAQEENNELVDAVQEDEKDYTKLLQETLEFQQFSSCKEMDTVLTEFIKKFKVKERRYGGPMLMEKSVDFAVTDGTPMPESTRAEDTVTSSSNEYSSTNLQKKNVDEPEIIKTNWKNIFYYNQQEQKIYILKSPLDIEASTITIDNAKIVSIVNIPKWFNKTQLFVTDDRLVILAGRYHNFRNSNRILWRDTRTSVAIYDISDVENIKLKKFTDLDWYYRNARMIENQLYILSEMNINRRTAYQRSEDKEEISFSKLSPKAIDISIDEDTELRDISVSWPSCDQVSYIFPSDDTIEEINMYPVFTVISIIDIDDTEKKTSTSVLLANAWEIHMSEESLYITQNLRFYKPRVCPMWARCIMPNRDDGAFTLIHKFWLDSTKLDYKTSNIVPWNLLTQYSMDEDADWNFRILTRADWRDWTNFYALDSNLKVKWSILNIEPGEQFKASRYIWDKLYLVTFQQTDPLFVIDIKNISKPKIIWELKIPGFSTYLHPLWALQNNIQYLVWLWYTANDRGRQEWLQLSLYEVDYNKNETEESRCGRLSDSVSQDEYTKCKENVSQNNISVTQLDTVSYGGKGSFSEAMQNTRMFVMDSKNKVTLPMVLQEEVQNGERCSVYKDQNGTEIKSDCYQITKQETTFAGLKTLKFDTNSKKIDEEFSVDYFNLFEKLYKNEESEYYNINSRQIRNTQMRVWFAWDALYMINNDFSHFILPWNSDWNQNGKYIYFDSNLE